MRFRSARPLRRSLIKILSPVFWGRGRAHNHDWWPFLTITREANGEPGEAVYKGKGVARLHPPEHLKKHSRQHIHIIGSGPSIAMNDLPRLEAGSAILLNGAIDLIGTSIADPLAIAIEDERFVSRHFPMMREKIPETATCLFSVGVLRAICELNPGWLAAKTIILIDDLRKPYGSGRKTYDELEKLPFIRTNQSHMAALSLDPTEGTVGAGSVAVTALQFAIYCHPQGIGLFGIDISNANAPRFYETEGTMAKSGIASAEDRLLAHFALARSICDEVEIALWNFSPISALLKIGLEYDARFRKE
ncbi:MAG: glycosyl transferase [Phyllobacterium sp.]